MPSEYFFCFENWEAALEPIFLGETYTFMSEIIKEMRPIEDTRLWRLMEKKTPFQNNIIINNTRVRTLLDSPEKLNLYKDRCLSLYESIRLRGYRSEPPFGIVGSDFQIGVAIGENGQVYHFRTGHHRLAVAKLLGIESVPVSIQLISGNLVNRVFPRLISSERKAIDAINECINHSAVIVHRKEKE